MADLSDVVEAIGSLVAATLYPDGAESEDASPICGWPVLVVAGWPTKQSLDAAMPAGKAVVSVYPRPGERNTTRYAGDWKVGAVHPTTWTLAAVGHTIVVGGDSPATFAPQNLTVFVDGKPYVAQSTLTSTLDSLAAGLAAAMVADWPSVAAAGPVVTLPALARIGSLRVGSTADARKEVRRQERQFQISIWAPSPEARSAVTKGFDPVLADTPFIMIGDGTDARLHYHGTIEIDADQLQGIWRRDLIYTVEYVTTREAVFTQIGVMQENLRDAQGTIIHSSTS